MTIHYSRVEERPDYDRIEWKDARASIFNSKTNYGRIFEMSGMSKPRQSKERVHRERRSTHEGDSLGFLSPS